MPPQLVEWVERFGEAWGFPVLPHPLPRSSQAWVTYDSLHQELEILESALQGPASVPHPSALGG